MTTRRNCGKKRIMKTLLSGLLVCVLMVTAVSGNDWRRFRGPDGQGHADAKNLPVVWSETENVLWKTAVPGRGWSSPVFADGVIWLTTAIDTPLTGEELKQARSKMLAFNPLADQMNVVGTVSLRAVSIDAVTGKLLSDDEILSVKEPPAIHSLNSFASPTPILDGRLLFCHFGEMGTLCFDTQAKKVAWKTVLPASLSVGAGSSPLVHGDLVIVPCDGTDKQYVVALNKVTGKEVWKTKRPKMSGFLGDYHKSYCTPLVVTVKGQEQVVIPGAQWVVAYEPDTGKEIWRVRHGDGFSNAPCPVVAGDLVCICTGYMKPEVVAIRMDGSGDVTKSHVAWRISKQAPTMPSPVIVGHEMYMVNDQGVATCANTSDGSILWSKRIAGNYSSSPLSADDKIYFSSREGKTTVIKPGSEFTELAVNSLEGQLMASPAVFEESLILRTDSHLYRIGAKPAK